MSGATPSGATPGALALVFVQISLLAFGGGNTILPEMHRQIVDIHGWMSAREFVAAFPSLAPADLVSASERLMALDTSAVIDGAPAYLTAPGLLTAAGRFAEIRLTIDSSRSKACARS